MMDQIQQRILEEVADLHVIPEGAYNIRANGESAARNTTANIDIINKSGAWYAYNGEKIGQGRENAKLYLAQNPSVMAEIEAKVRAHYGLDMDVEA